GARAGISRGPDGLPSVFHETNILQNVSLDFMGGDRKQKLPGMRACRGGAPGQNSKQMSNICYTNHEKSVIIGHCRSLNPSGELKTGVGGTDRSTIFGQSVSTEGRVIPATRSLVTAITTTQPVHGGLGALHFPEIAGDGRWP